MTRKRKNTEQDVDLNESKSKLAGFGDVKSDQKSKRAKAEDAAPQKSKGFENQYESKEWPKQENSADQEEGRFPTELIRYLKQMAKEEPEADLVDIFMDKCLEEVKGREETLLGYTEGCYVVEQIFLRSKNGAFEFLERLNHRKKANRLQLIFNAASERTIEKLLYSLVPLEEETHIQMIANWIELVIDNWQDLIFDRSGSFFIRTLGRVLIGLNEEHMRFKSTFEAIQSANIGRKRVKPSAKTELKKVITRVFDFVSMKDFLNFSSVALIVQNYAAFDKFLKANIGIEFVKKFIETGDVGNSWKKSDSSRVWESLVELMDEDMHELIFDSIKEDLVTIATNEFGRYPMETLFKRSKSEKIAEEVADKMLPMFDEFLQRETVPPIIGQTLQLISNHEDLQKKAMKLLLEQFNAKEAETRLHFFPNILTLNNSNAKIFETGELTFEVGRSKLFGSIILEQLFQFCKKKSLMESFKKVSTTKLNEMALHTIASHVFDGFARSAQIEIDDKKEVFGNLDLDALVKNSYGSRVFESFWFELDWSEGEREKIINDLFLPLMASTERNKFVGILLNKLHVNEFRENRKQWKSDLTKWIEEERAKRLHNRLFDSRNKTSYQNKRQEGQSTGKKQRKRKFKKEE